MLSLIQIIEGLSNIADDVRVLTTLEVFQTISKMLLVFTFMILSLNSNTTDDRIDRGESSNDIQTESHFYLFSYLIIS